MDERVKQLIDSRPVQASLERAEGRLMLAMPQELDRDPEWVWAMLTQPDQLARWSAIVPDRPLTEVGPATSVESPGQPAVPCDVSEVQAPNVLMHLWGDHVLRWRVVGLGERTQLSLHELFTDAGDAPMYAAGWHVCFSILTGVAQGLDVPRAVGAEAMAYGWETLRDRYAEILPDPGPEPQGLGDLPGRAASGGGGGGGW